MDSSRIRNVSKGSDPAKSSRRSLYSSSSFSSCSFSSLVFSGDSPLNSPETPLHLLGVPFSWEQLPGKPKDYSHKLNHRRNNESLNLLPLPPHRSNTFPATAKSTKSVSSTKKHTEPMRDPFAAALLECSKGEGTNSEQEDGEKVDRRSRGSSSKVLAKRSIGDKFGLVMNLSGSCRRTCVVSESIVYIPRSRKAASYNHLRI